MRVVNRCFSKFEASRFLTSISQPSTRRSPKKNPGAVAGPVKSINFTFQIQKVLSQIYTALEVGIMPLNKDYKLIRNIEDQKESISLDVGEKGFYIFSVDWLMELLTVQTPISGIRQYEYEPEEDTWLNTIDRHDMRGLVTRDLLRHSRGCPKF